MTWEIEWSHPALAVLRALPWRHAERIDRAVLRLAQHQEGELYRADNHPLGARLRVGPYGVYLTLDPTDGVMRVWYVYRR